MTTVLETSSSAAQGPLALRPIDRMHLARQALGDPGIEIEILRMFDGVVASHFGRLTADGAANEMLHHLHMIKAAAVGVGAWALAEHAYVIEGELRSGEPFDEERVDDLSFCVAEVRGFIAGLVAEDDAAFDADFGETVGTA